MSFMKDGPPFLYCPRGKARRATADNKKRFDEMKSNWAKTSIKG